jgi:hypothetical protein
MKDSIQKEVTEVGNSGHVIVPKDWIGEEVKVIRVDKDFTAEDAESTIGLLNEIYERLLESDTEYEGDLKVAIEMCSRYGDLHYNFNTDLIDKIDRLTVKSKNGEYDIGRSIAQAKELEKSNGSMNENKKAVFSYFSALSSGMSPSEALSQALEKIES